MESSDEESSEDEPEVDMSVEKSSTGKGAGTYEV